MAVPGVRMRRLTLRGLRLLRLAQAALGHEAVGQQQDRLVGGRGEAVGGMRRVDRAARFAELEPARALARLEADELRAVLVRQQPGATPAPRQIGLGRALDARLALRSELDRADDREAVGPAPGEQLVARAAELLGLHARARPTLGWLLRLGGRVGQR